MLCGHSLYAAGHAPNDAMKVESLSIHEFRGIRDLELSFGDGVNVLLGVNGVGKSGVLDCAAVLLSRLFARIRSTTGTGRFFSESDINNHATETRNKIKVDFRGEPTAWTVAKSRRGRRRQRITNLTQLRRRVARLHDDLANKPSIPLPVAVYYPVHRAVLDVPLRTRKRAQFDRMAAYDQALSGGWSLRTFFEWFRAREDIENERRVDRPRHRDPQLQAVRTAVEQLLPGFSGLRVKRSPRLRMVVLKGGEELVVSQLSDGEKCLLAMVGDLARRMAVANPQMRDPLDTEATVLVDELDLHLHPAWQRLVPDALKNAFPNTQFIASTHSPAIVSYLPAEKVCMLRREGGQVGASRPETAYGQQMGRSLEDVMEVVDRPPHVKDKIVELFDAIEDGRLEDATRQRDALQRSIGSDPDIVRASTLIHRRRVLGA